MADGLLIALILMPLALCYLLKSNAALVFLSLCASEVLITFTVSDATRLLNNFNFKAPDTDVISLGIVVVLMLLTMFFTHRPGKFLTQAGPALAAGVLLAIMAVPLLSGTVQADFASSQVWTNLQKIQAWVVGIGVFWSFGLIWLESKKPRGKHHKH